MSGYTIARKNDYYSPLPAVSQLGKTFTRWYRPSRLGGIERDIDEMKAELSNLLSRHQSEFSALPANAELHKQGFGQGFPGVDGLTLYLMIRNLKPRRYIEVGSGLSTYYCSLAAEKNAKEGHPLQITCIEPYPFKQLHSIPGIHVIAKEVQDVDPAMFQQLQKGDVLFIDSSHVVNIDGDVPFLYLEILPSLNPGVVIHIHDIPFPYNCPYPPQLWIFKQAWPMFWNEAMILQAFLCFNNQFRIELSLPLIRFLDEPFLARNIPRYETIEQNPNTFSSIWLRRVS